MMHWETIYPPLLPLETPSEFSVFEGEKLGRGESITLQDTWSTNNRNWATSWFVKSANESATNFTRPGLDNFFSQLSGNKMCLHHFALICPTSKALNVKGVTI